MLARMVPVHIKSGNFQTGPKALVHGRFDWESKLVQDVVQSTSSFSLFVRRNTSCQKVDLLRCYEPSIF
jgi:hypothetical protein